MVCCKNYIINYKCKKGALIMLGRVLIMCLGVNGEIFIFKILQQRSLCFLEHYNGFLYIWRHGLLRLLLLFFGDL